MDLPQVIANLRRRRIIPEFISEQTIIQFLKYVATGFLTVGLDFLILFILTDIAKLWYLASKILTYIVTFWFNFLVNRSWSFNSKKNLARQLSLYLILFIFNGLVISSLMYQFTDVLKFHYLISNIFVVGVVTIWNFFLYKKIIYK